MKNLPGILHFLFFFSFSLLQAQSDDNEIVLKPNYTSISWNVSYKSVSYPQETHNGLVEGYYKIVEVVVDLILPDALPHEILNLGLGELTFLNIGKILWAYRRLTIFLVIIIVEIFFLIGSNLMLIRSWLSFCTKYGSQKSSKPNCTVKKWLWLAWVYTALCFLLLMLILAHQSNQNVDDGFDHVVIALDDTIVDIELFVDTTLKQLEVLLLNNLQDYLAFFLDTGEKTTMNILRDLEGVLGALDFSKIFEDIEDNFNFVKPIFDEIETVLSEVEDLGKTINKEIVGLKNMVENLICETAECEQLKKLVPSLQSIYDGGTSLVNGSYVELENIAGLGEEGLKALGNFTYLIGGKAIEEGKALKNLTSKIAGGVFKEAKALKNLTANIAGNIATDLEITGGGLANLTSDIGGKAIEGEKAIENLTANIAGNVINDLEVTGGGLANLTSAIGEEAIEEGKALENLTANIAGNIVTDLEITGGGLANLTSAIGGKAIEREKALENLTANIAGNVINDLEVTGGGLANLTSAIGGEAIEEGKALENLTANIAGNIVTDLEITGGGLANLTSAIGGKAIEGEKALENLTANIAGNVINDLEVTGGGFANLTSAIGGEAIEEGKALENLTANIAGNVVTDLEITGGGLANLTSAIGGKAIEGEKALENLTANIAGNVLTELEVTGVGLANLTSAIGGEAIEEGKALENLTANIAGNIVTDLEITGGGLANLTSAIGGKAIEGEKALENLTANIAGNVINDLEVTGGGLANLTSAIGEEAIEEGKALGNLTANIAGNIVTDLEITGGGLTNLTSAIAGKAIEGEKALENLTANIAGNVITELEVSGGGLANLTSAIGGEAIEEEKALGNLTANIAGNIVTDLESTGGGLTNLTSAIGGKAIEGEKALENLTANIAGNVITELEVSGGGLANLTSAIGGEAIEEGKALGNLTANIAGNIVTDLEITGGGLTNLTSAIGGKVIEGEKALENLTANIAGNVITELEVSGGGLANLTSAIGGEAIEEGKALGNLTANIAGNIVTDLEITGGGLTNLTSAIGGKAIEGEKALENLTANVAGSVIEGLEDTGKGLTNLTENIVGGLEDVAGGVGSEITNEGKALTDLTENIAGGVVGGIDNVAGGLEDEVEDVFGGIGAWTFGSKNGGKKAKDNKPTSGVSAVSVTGKTPGNSTADFTGNVIIQDLKENGKGLTNLTENIVGGLGNVAGGVENEIESGGKALKDLTGNVAVGVVSGIGNIAGGLDNEVEDVFGGLGNWTFGSKNEGKKSKDNKPTSGAGKEVGKISGNSTADLPENVIIQDLEKTGKGFTNFTENIVGGLENVAGGLENEIKNEGKALKDLTGNVAGGVVSGIGNVAGGVESEIGGLFGGLEDWTFGSGSKKENPKNIVPNDKKSQNENEEKKEGKISRKDEIIDIFTFNVSSNREKHEKIDESTMDLTLNLNNDPKVNLKDLSIDQSNGFNSLFAGLGNLSSKMEKGGQNKGNINADKNIGKIVVSSTTVKSVEKKSQNGFGSFFGGLENFASGVSNGIIKSETQLEGLTSNVVGKIGGTANAVESKVGGLFGDWSSGGSSKNKNKARENERITTEKTIIKKTENNGYGGWFGGSSTSNDKKKSDKTSKSISSKVSGGIGKLYGMGENLFSFRKKRDFGLSFNDLKEDFNMIFSTIDRIENYVINDLKHLNNVSVILSPIIDEMEGIVKEVLVEVADEIKEATKPLESFFATTLDEVIAFENSILNATHIIQDTQEIINWFEVYRYRISNFIAAALLISFTLLTFGVSVRVASNNAITKCFYKGGFTLLHLTALLMAVTSMVYILIGVTSQKVLCETFDTNFREDNIMRILSRIDPAKYGLLVDINLHKIILRCHHDKSLYEVTAFKSVMNIEKLALDFFDLDSIEKEFEPLLNMNVDLSKYLPLKAIHSIEEDLNFESFEKILDFPIFAQMEKLEKEFTSIPLIGPIIEGIAGKIISFKDKIAAIQTPVQTANIGFPNLLTNIKKLLFDVENGLMEIEEESVKTFKHVVVNFKTILVTSLKDYVYNRLIYSIEHEVGRCKPLSAAFNSTLNSVCERITRPANGHWFSWFLGVILSIFLIALSKEVDGKINRLSEEEGIDSSDDSPKNADEIEMTSLSNNKVNEIDCEKNGLQSKDAV